MNKEKEVMDV